MGRTVMGILAPVDAGKTTLSEAILHLGGVLKTPGRVDHGDAFLDTDTIERERGITIFSKQAIFYLNNREVFLLDTPGHVDFSSEAERVLRVLDCAIFVISGADGIGGHALTLWKLLETYQIPVFIFVNKMDLPGTDESELLNECKKKLHPGCVDFSGRDFNNNNNNNLEEEVALCDEDLLERYLETGEIKSQDYRHLISNRKLFPCIFGSALKLRGVDELLNIFDLYAPSPEYPEEFGARIFKITRDERGNKCAWLKVTGGILRTKMNLSPGQQIEQIRLYSGVKYQTAREVPAGTVCAVTGLSDARAGDGLGFEPNAAKPILEPPLYYQVFAPDNQNPRELFDIFKKLEEEDPQLQIRWNTDNPAQAQTQTQAQSQAQTQAKSIQVRLMGDMQLEILKRILSERYNLNHITFGPGMIAYRETIGAPCEGIGHFEPLRHYAEVRLLLQPLPPGSGLVFSSACPTDILARHWQRLIFTHLAEKEHIGVLTGSPVTDIKMMILSGKASEKHTEGGDFREATYRAVRQALMSARNILLEPWYLFRLALPSDSMGRALTEIKRAGGEIQPPESDGVNAVLTGSAPVAFLRDYAAEIRSYTKGRGGLELEAGGYRPCPNPEEIITRMDYHPEHDINNPSGSIFCSRGAGVYIPWDLVPAMAHTTGVNPDFDFNLEHINSDAPDFDFNASAPVSGAESNRGASNAGNRAGADYAANLEQDKELKAIFERTYGPVKQRRDVQDREARGPKAQNNNNNNPASQDRDYQRRVNKNITGPEYLLIDGYNIIFAWDDLKAIARESLDAARIALCDLLCEYQGVKGCEIITVFDAYKVKNNPGSHEKYHNIHIVYTKEAETADTYIERASYELGKNHRVRVATSDGPEQLIILGHGALRVSASMFRQEMEAAQIQIQQELEKINRPERVEAIRTAMRNAMKKQS